MGKTPGIFLAFDNLREKPQETLYTAQELADAGEPFGMKVNLDALLDKGILSLVSMIRRFGRPMFLDFKMWNGTRTMEDIVKTCVDLGVDFVNVYALADKQLAKAVKATEGSKTKILSLTVLSHYDDAYCQKWFRRSLREAVADFSQYAVDAGCHGILLPGTALEVVKDLDTIKVATGLRPEWYKDSRHEQEATPAQVALGGADFTVCGSPVLKQASTQECIDALQRILTEMEEAVAG